MSCESSVYTWNLRDFWASDADADRYAAVVEVIRELRPTVIAVQEVIAADQATAMVQLARLAELTQMSATVSAGSSGEADSDRPTSAGAAGGNRFATGLTWARDLDITVQPNSFRPYRRNDFFHSLTKLDLKLGGERITVASWHGCPIGQPRRASEAERVVSALLGSDFATIGSDVNSIGYARVPDGHSGYRFYDDDPYAAQPWQPGFVHTCTRPAHLCVRECLGRHAGVCCNPRVAIDRSVSKRRGRPLAVFGDGEGPVRFGKCVVVGLGYVGLRSAVACAEAGYRTVGYDIDASRVDGLRNGAAYTSDLSPERIRGLIASGGLTLTTDDAEIAGFDAAFISVPTPLKDERPDLGPVVSAARMLATKMAHPAVVVVESTNFPGSTETVIAPIFEQATGGLEGAAFFLAFAPERVNPGSPDMSTPPKIVGGVSERSGDVAQEFLATIYAAVHRVSSARCAEFAKLVENTYRLVNISLANEMSEAAKACGVDMSEALDAAETKGYGFARFDPGVGVGGHCIPVDPVYLLARLQEVSCDSTTMIKAALSVNDRRPALVGEDILQRLATIGVEPSEATIVAYGVTYKPDVPDVRESAAIKVVQHLLSRGARVDVIDPIVNPNHPAVRRLGIRARLDRSAAKYDAAIVLTAHAELDVDELASMATILVDLHDTARRRSAPQRLATPA